MKLKAFLMAALAACFVFVGCDMDQILDGLTPDTEQTPDTGEEGEDSGENLGTEISFADFLKLPNDDTTLYKVSGVVWLIDINYREEITYIVMGDDLYSGDDENCISILNPTWLENLEPALRPGHVLTVNGRKGEMDGAVIIQESKYVSHVEYSDPYVAFDMEDGYYCYSEAGEETFTIYSNTDWTITAPEGTSVTPSSGKGCAELTFKYPANDKLEEKFYEIVVNYAGKATTLVFEQMGLEYKLELTKSHVEVPADATSCTVDIISNGEWAVSTSEDLTATPASGKGNATVTFTFPANTAQEPVQYIAQIAGSDSHGMTYEFEFIIDQAEAEVQKNVVTIAEILKLGKDATVPANTFIEGNVISNVDLNNLTSKKSLYIQDETAGLQFYLAANHTFAFGDKLLIDLSSATIGEYSGAVQVSGLALAKITKVSSGNTTTPKTVSITDFLANKYEGQYIALEGIQVSDSDLSKTWGSSSGHTSINMEDANGNKFVVFSSRYATYRNETVSQGSGTIKGIASINNSKIQLIFAQKSDYADLTGPRLVQEEKKVPVTAISLNKTSIEIVEGDNFTLTATITPDNATNKNIIWSSSNSNVASVSNGIVTGLTPGQTTITATSEDGGMTATCEVSVTKRIIHAETITLDKTQASLLPGDEMTLIATISPTNAIDQTVIWSSSDPSIVSVNNGQVRALALGKATITAATQDGDKRASCTISVVNIDSLINAEFTNINIGSGTMSFEGSYIKLTSGVEMSVSLNNSSRHDIKVHGFAMICSLSNWKVEYSINETILSGEHSLKFKVPIGMTMYAPIAEFTYIYNDVTYTATVRYNGSF